MEPDKKNDAPENLSLSLQFMVLGVDDHWGRCLL
jgi:hypothetical protein